MVGGARVPGMGEVRVAEFVQGSPWLWEIFPLAMLLGGPFRPGWVGLVGERVIGGGGGLGEKFGQGLPCLKAIFSVEGSLGVSFGTCVLGYGGGGGFWRL